MKYIKTYEGVKSKKDNILDIEDVRSFCEYHLAELIDYGYKVIVDYVGNKGQIVYHQTNECQILLTNAASNIIWGKVRNTFIPFFHMTDLEYDIQVIKDNRRNYRIKINRYVDQKIGNECVNFENYYENYYYTKEEIFKGNCGIMRSLEHIKFFIKSK
jgi:hypothetical protein